MIDKKLKLALLALGLAAAALGGAALFFGLSAASLKNENLSLSQKVSDLNKSVALATNKASMLGAKIKEYESALDTLRSENDSLRGDLALSKAQFESLIEEKVYLEDILIHKTKEIEKIKRSTPVGSAAAGQLEEKEGEIARLAAQNAVLSSKIERLYQATQDKLASINVSKIALEETVARARRAIQEEYDSIDLGAIQVESPAAAPKTPAVSRPEPVSPPYAPEQKTAPRTGPRQEGRIRAINETHGFVVVDLGKVDNIKESTTLYVMKNGQRAAILTVLEVRDVMSACNIKETAKGYHLKVNDPVSIQK